MGQQVESYRRAATTHWLQAGSRDLQDGARQQESGRWRAIGDSRATSYEPGGGGATGGGAMSRELQEGYRRAMTYCHMDSCTELLDE